MKLRIVKNKNNMYIIQKKVWFFFWATACNASYWEVQFSDLTEAEIMVGKLIIDHNNEIERKKRKEVIVKEYKV